MNKTSLPSKVCPVCERSFDWRRKWRLNWADVIYCSERCRRSRVRPLRKKSEMRK